MKACAITGYRPEKLPFGGDEAREEIDAVKRRIFCEILRMTREGVSIFISGMARGVDMWAAETVFQIRDTLPDRNVQLWAAIPYNRQAASWKDTDKERYARILERADRIEYISHAYYSGCFHKRNRWMVEHATHLLAVYDGKTGGTRYTVNYARDRGLNMTIIEP